MHMIENKRGVFYKQEMQTNQHSKTMNVQPEHENNEEMSSFDKSSAKTFVEKSNLCDC